MSVYTKQYRLRNADVDLHRRLRWDTMFTMLQEASIAHTEQLGAGREKTLDRGFLWVVTLQQVSVTRLPEYDETITVESWAGKTMHVFFPRYYRILDARGAVLVEGSALWGLMDQTTRKLIFPDEQNIEVEGVVTGLESPLPRPLRSGEIAETSQFTVPYSYLDLNGHMNNTRYFDLVQDVLPPEIHAQPLKHITVEYAGEARWGQTISVGLGQTETGWFVCGDADRRIFRMWLTFQS